MGLLVAEAHVLYLRHTYQSNHLYLNHCDMMGKPWPWRNQYDPARNHHALHLLILIAFSALDRLPHKFILFH